MAHAPAGAVQALQPSCLAKGEQQAPPRQAPLAQAASAAQGAPARAGGGGCAEALGEALGAAWQACAPGGEVLPAGHCAQAALEAAPEAALAVPAGQGTKAVEDSGQ